MPAATMGSSCQHGGIVEQGSPDVKIGGKSAARVGDNHKCPQNTAGIAHEGGPILPPGCTKVLINGKAAARAQDTMSCKDGSIDTIIGGDMTVMIG
ncbi:MAG: PAAR domain-containing protein [Chloroflexota bacterium]